MPFDAKTTYSRQVSCFEFVTGLQKTKNRVHKINAAFRSLDTRMASLIDPRPTFRVSSLSVLGIHEPRSSRRNYVPNHFYSRYPISSFQRLTSVLVLLLFRSEAGLAPFVATAYLSHFDQNLTRYTDTTLLISSDKPRFLVDRLSKFLKSVAGLFSPKLRGSE
ncbi:uncharacterized protein BDW43DRAFT_289185 [Aspergillus alliaceus]|uniref:uncharacterized protein n=1 Tax=Petromyces alliaceus TaxID=209559 RepID=UPI0012A5B437|nr:uncharacterized protein BDW43DRAFT_289185 [Aspergillus alliaceus]KAB8229071.1 hypothetical protein BDW43DRAFT_289185 [Aspergillus alliaceus]